VAFDGTTQTLARLEIAGQILTAIVWFLWLHRAVANARSLGVQTEATPGWSVGWWFIPFANVVKPYQILRSLFYGLVSGSARIVGVTDTLRVAAAILAAFTVSRIDDGTASLARNYALTTKVNVPVTGLVAVFSFTSICAL
jgi:hypothetical protein